MKNLFVVLLLHFIYSTTVFSNEKYSLAFKENRNLKYSIISHQLTENDSGIIISQLEKFYNDTSIITVNYKSINDSSLKSEFIITKDRGSCLTPFNFILYFFPPRIVYEQKIKVTGKPFDGNMSFFPLYFSKEKAETGTKWINIFNSKNEADPVKIEYSLKEISSDYEALIEGENKDTFIKCIFDIRQGCITKFEVYKKRTKNSFLLIKWS